MLRFKIKTTTMGVGKRKGQKVFFATPITQDRLTAREVEERIVNATALSRADIRAAITALAEVVREEMFSGRAVDLADLGSFKVVSNGKRMDTEQEVTELTLKTPRIQFFPKQEMREKAKAVTRIIVRETKPNTKPGKKPQGGGTENP